VRDPTGLPLFSVNRQITHGVWKESFAAGCVEGPTGPRRNSRRAFNVRCSRRSGNVLSFCQSWNQAGYAGFDLDTLLNAVLPHSHDGCRRFLGEGGLSIPRAFHRWSARCRGEEGDGSCTRTSRTRIPLRATPLRQPFLTHADFHRHPSGTAGASLGSGGGRLPLHSCSVRLVTQRGTQSWQRK
jgi:hypothetical protein